MKRLFLIAALQLVVLIGFAAEPLLKFGVIADIQYCDDNPRGSRYYRNSLQKLDDVVEALNQENVSFTVNLGDLVERDAVQNLPAVLERLKDLDNPVYNTTGNHDHWGVEDHNWLFKTVGMPASYYAFTEGNWRFIVLNTNEVSSYTTMAKKKEFAAMDKKISDEKRPTPTSYNGGVGKKQMRWLKRELKKAGRCGMNVLLFSHHPLHGVPGLNALNDVEIVELLSKFPGTVRGAIAGHHHDGAFAIQDGIFFITVDGIVETENDNAFGVVTIYPDRLELEGYGRTEPQKILLTEAAD